MVQQVEYLIWDLFEEERKRMTFSQRKNTFECSHSNIPQGEWMKKVTGVLRISELAKEYNVSSCPRCDYSLNFNDGRGWFCCENKKWGGNCDFAGNIVDFVQIIMEEENV